MLHWTGHAAKFHTDTKNAVENIALIKVETLLDEIPKETKIVCVELVEGADLYVEDDCVYMKTIAGPSRVDVIYRRIDDAFLDPMP